jgi:hypothetical protein
MADRNPASVVQKWKRCSSLEVAQLRHYSICPLADWVDSFTPKLAGCTVTCKERILSPAAPSSCRYNTYRGAHLMPVLFILLHMDTHCSTSPSVSPPLSLAGPQFEIEVDTVIKGVSETSLEAPKASEGACHGTIFANKNQLVGDVERDDNWILDTRNPRNWPSGKKWASVSVVSPTVWLLSPHFFKPIGR